MVLLKDGVKGATYEVPVSDVTHENDKRPNYISSLGFANEERLLGLDHFSKSLVAFDSSSLDVLSQRQFPKRPSAWSVAPDNWLLVGDKFGDVYRIPLDSTASLVNELGQTTVEPILGHVSMLLDVASTSTSVLTSDRDEHIRVSSYPEAYRIERFLWGHNEYVAYLAVVGDYVVSGGGDTFVICSSWRTGEHQKFDLGQENVDLAFIRAAGTKCLIGVESVSKLWLVEVPSLEAEEIDLEHPPTDACVSGEKIYVTFANELGIASLESPTKMDLIRFDSVPVELSNALLRKRPRE